MSHLSQRVYASISILIADADRMSAHLIADGLTRGRNDIVVVAVSNSSDETIRELEKNRPDIALINAHLKDGRLRGYHVLQYLQVLSPKTVAIMLIPDSERDLVVNAFRGGARGVFCRVQPIKLLRNVFEPCTRVRSGLTPGIWLISSKISLSSSRCASSNQAVGWPG